MLRAPASRLSWRIVAAWIVGSLALLGALGPAAGAQPGGSSLSADPRDPAVVGRWERTPLDAPVTPIHGALLRTGEVWLGSGSGNDPTHAGGPFKSFVWDPVNGSIDNVSTPWDLFCAGHAFLPNGKLLVAGGTLAYPSAVGAGDWKGSPKAYLFDPISRAYSPLPDMAGGRWYPTVLTLPSGRVYAFAGLDATGAGNNVTPEIFDPGSRAWSTRPETAVWPMYPALFAAHGGGLLYTGGNVFGDQGMSPGLLDVATSELHRYPGLTLPNLRDQSASVLLPPAQRQRYMIVGGGGQGIGPAISNVDVIDLTAAQPRFQHGPAMNIARMHVNAVLLPDRTVLVTGGGRRREADPVYRAEIYDPRASTWTLVAPESVARLYHSLDVLLPDGRVLVAGSNPDGHWELRMEVYSPPYLFRGTRPAITSSPDQVAYGGSFRIRSTQADHIKWVSLIRPSSVTHSMDPEQRVVDLPATLVGSGELELSVTGDRTVAPPGWYMLFVSNANGVPSVARWVHLG